MGCLGHSFVCLLSCLGLSCVCLGAVFGCIGSVWGCLGSSWVGLGRLWGGSWIGLGGSRTDLGRFWEAKRPYNLILDYSFTFLKVFGELTWGAKSCCNLCCNSHRGLDLCPLHHRHWMLYPTWHMHRGHGGRHPSRATEAMDGGWNVAVLMGFFDLVTSLS